MMTWVVQVVVIHVGDQLLEHGPLQDLAQDGQYGNRSIVLGIQLATLSFIQRDNFGYLPFGWKLV